MDVSSLLRMTSIFSGFSGSIDWYPIFYIGSPIFYWKSPSEVFFYVSLLSEEWRLTSVVHHAAEKGQDNVTVPVPKT